MIKQIRKTRKNESRKNKRWFVLDLNTTEECDSLEDALDKAEWWIQNQKDILEDADDEEVARWYRAGDRGLDTGDVEVYEVDADDEDILDYDGRVSGIKIMSDYEPVEVFSGFAVTEEEAEKRKLESRSCLRRNMKLEKRGHKLFEGAGSGVKINVHEFNGKLVSVEDGGKDCDCNLHLENCSMLGSTVSTYYWGSPDWLDGDFKNGKVDLKVNFYEDDENDIYDIINSLKLGQTISIDDLKITHGGGSSHVSLDGECEGRSDDTFMVFDKDGYYVNCEIQSIVFNFGKQIEDFYQDAEQAYLDEENEKEFESIRRRRNLRRVIESRRLRRR